MHKTTQFLDLFLKSTFLKAVVANEWKNTHFENRGTNDAAVELFPENTAQMTVMLFLKVLPQTDWCETGHDCSINEIYLVYLFKMCTVFKQKNTDKPKALFFWTLKHTERFFDFFFFFSTQLDYWELWLPKCFFSLSFTVFFFLFLFFFKDCSCWLIEVQYVLYACSS